MDDDPLRFLKRRKSKQTGTVPKISISQPPYDPEKYRSRRSEDYLKLIGYSQAVPPRETKISSPALSELAELVRGAIKSSQKSRKIGTNPVQPDPKHEIIPDDREDNGARSQGVAENQLRQCISCGRKFNLQSYEKHTKVCERVFCQKRKSFSSEKQRGKSAESQKK